MQCKIMEQLSEHAHYKNEKLCTCALQEYRNYSHAHCRNREVVRMRIVEIEKFCALFNVEREKLCTCALQE
jgi:hypothetical protein